VIDVVISVSESTAGTTEVGTYIAEKFSFSLSTSRLGREYLASSDEELSRSAAAAEALMLWQKR